MAGRLTPPAVRLAGVSKRFGGVTALHEVSVDVQPGTCHALMGENGAGKSTLGNVLAGIHRPDAGRVELDGAPVDFRDPADALAAGVAMVHQELAFCPELSVAENLALGRWPRTALGLIDRRAMAARAEHLLDQVGAALDVSAPLGRLSTGQEQLVQIAAALGTGARVLVLDEPTSSLSEGEAEQLFALVRRLRDEGVTLIYVSHRIPEVLDLCDRITVLRDGAVAGTLERGEADEAGLVRLMVGREVTPPVLAHLEREPGDVVLQVEGLTSPAGVRDVSLTVRAGEIVGLAGLVGAGRSEVLSALFGLDPEARGEVSVDGRPLRLGSVSRALEAGLGLVPEDRKRQGLVLEMDVSTNTALAWLPRLRRGPFLDRQREAREVQRALSRLEVRAPSLATLVSQLSGGNQQKVVLARWIARGGRVLLVDEPTRGVDVGAKAAIHALLDELAAGGAAILLVSSELPEVLGLSRRVLVMRDGRLVARLDREQADADTVLGHMAGVGARGRSGGC